MTIPVSDSWSTVEILPHFRKQTCEDEPVRGGRWWYLFNKLGVQTRARTHTEYIIIYTRADHTTKKKHSLARIIYTAHTRQTNRPSRTIVNSGDPVLTCTIARWSPPPKTCLSPSVSITIVSLSHTQYVPHSISHTPSRSLTLSLSLSHSLTLSLALGLSQTLSGSSQTVVQQVLSVFTPAVAAAVAFQWGINARRRSVQRRRRQQQ